MLGVRHICFLQSVCSNSAITLKSYAGQSSEELTFGVGSLITDVWQKTKDW